jgi:folate-binding protein YgfZ
MSNSRDLQLHEQAGAALAEAHGRPLPSHYSTVAKEYQALTEGVALLDRSFIGRLSLTGEDALDLLNRLSTNDLMGLQVDRGIPTVLTSNKGRIIDLLYVLRLADRLLVLTAPENRQTVADRIDFYTFTEDVTIQDITEETAMLSVAGPGGASLLDGVSGADISSLGRYDSVHVSMGGVETTLIRTDLAQLPVYDLIVAGADGQRLWRELLIEGEGVDVKPVGMEALEAARVEQGVPVYGKELSEEFNPLEANLLEYISFTKGCYVGQEVVARLDTYKKVKKHLVGLRWDSDSNPAPGAKLLLDGKQVGVVTSAAKSPRLNRGVGLGYVRKAQAQPGTVLSMDAGDGEGPVEVVAAAGKTHQT